MGLFPQGADLPATNQRATTPTVRSSTSLSLRAISAAGAKGRGAWGGASVHKGPREEGRRSVREGENKGDKQWRPRGEAETGGGDKNHKDEDDGGDRA